MVNPELKENDPELAKLIESFEGRFHRNFDLSNVEHAATLAEGCREIGDHIARNSSSATLQVGTGADGVVSLTVTCSPNPAK